MNRREFFRSFAAVPIAASVVIPELTRTIFLPPAGGWPVDWRYKAVERYSAGFTDPRGVYGYEVHGLGYPIPKAEGEFIAYDPGRPIAAAEFKKTIARMLNEVYGEAYSEHDDEWAKIFASAKRLSPRGIL